MFSDSAFYVWVLEGYEIFQKVNNKGAYQAARVRRLVCACVV